MATTTEKSAAKKAPAKKSAVRKTPSKKSSAGASRRPTKKTAPAIKETRMKKLVVGDDVFINVDPRQNGGSSVAAAKVTKVGEDVVNLTVFLDNEENQWVRNVEVRKSEPKDDEPTSARYCWPA